MEAAAPAQRSSEARAEAEKAEAMARYCEILGVTPEYFDGKRVVDLGCGVSAWFPRALKERGRAADVLAVDWRWLLPEDDVEHEPFDAEAVAHELGDRAIAADFVLDELPLGGEVDSIVSVGPLTLSLQEAEDEFFGEVQAAVRSLLAKLAPGGELRLGPIVRQSGEPDGGAGYSRARALLAGIDGDGFELRFEPAGERPGKNLAFERAVFRRLA